jgi:hypothetical protein
LAKIAENFYRNSGPRYLETVSQNRPQESGNNGTAMTSGSFRSSTKSTGFVLLPHQLSIDSSLKINMRSVKKNSMLRQNVDCQVIKVFHPIGVVLHISFSRYNYKLQFFDFQ